LKNLSRYSLFVIATAVLSGFLFGYYMAIISGALLFISSAFRFSLNQESIFVSTLLFGAILGGSIGGYLTDLFGRKRVFMLTATLLILGCLILISATSYASLITARILQGIAIGIISVVVPLYLGEISPTAQRGGIVATYQMTMSIGILVAYLVNYGFTAGSNWQMMFLVGLIPALLQIAFLWFIPESPFWLFRKGKIALANKALKALGLPSSFEQGESKEFKISHKILSFILIIGILLSAFQQLSGVNVMIYYAPKIFHEAGYTSALSAMLATVSLGLANLIGCIISVCILDRVGRRILLLIGIVGMFTSLLCLCIFSFYNVSSMDKLSVVMLIVYMLFFAVGPGPVTWVLLSEIYPPQIRDRAMTFSLVANWVCVYLILLTFPYLFAWIKSFGTFGVYAALNLLGFLFVFKYIPETKNKKIFDICKLFKDLNFK
jgi:sugar porter (SP) family MFS transporter